MPAERAIAGSDGTGKNRPHKHRRPQETNDVNIPLRIVEGRIIGRSKKRGWALLLVLASSLGLARAAALLLGN